LFLLLQQYSTFNLVRKLPRPNIDRQIGDVDKAIAEYPEYKDLLNLHRAILRIREPVEPLLLKGSNSHCDLPLDLCQNVFSQKKPAIEFLTTSMIDEENAMSICCKVIQSFSRYGIGGENLLRVQDALQRGEIEIRQSLQAVIKKEKKRFEELGLKYSVNPKVMMYVFSIPVQSCLEEIARKMDASLLESWWQPSCPVCGEIPRIARLKNKKRYLVCSFCGAQFLADSFLCVNCGNRDPYKLGYMKPKNQTGLRIDYCEECKHYIKVVDEDKMLDREIPRGLEEILTQNLDKMICASLVG